MANQDTAAELDRIRETKARTPNWEPRVVRKVRDEGATQDEIAARLGVSQQQVSLILQRPTPDDDGSS